VTVRIYNMLGQLVRTLLDMEQAAGEKTVVWNATDDAGSLVASGMYFVRLNTPDATRTERVLYMK
jgi:flagellar hook assembly protein FlgD